MNAVTSAALEQRFSVVAQEWMRATTAMTAHHVPDDAAFASAASEAATLRARGEWASGPADMLSVLGRSRNELVHSRLLGWLLNPTGRHGMGDAFAVAFFAEIWPASDFPGGNVQIELERPRAGISSVTGATVEARADIVLTFEALVVVIENKLDAGEQADQCERLYWPWAAEAVETRWVFLTPSGREPVTATSEIARSAWTSMSYRQVRRALAKALSSRDAADELGRATAEQYLQTLIAALKA